MDIKNIYPNLTDDLSTLAIIANQLLTEIDLQLSQAQVIIKSSDDVLCKLGGTHERGIRPDNR